jgi:signal transduction histidine kinase/DNA-binding response OmpR family regulator
MALLRATSIQRKLTLVIMLVTTLALLVAAAQFVLNDVRDYRRRVVDDLAILTRILGQNVTPTLEFDDPKVAEQILASFQAKPHILAAAVYARDGKLFARYTPPDQPGAEVPATAPAEERRFSHGRALLCLPILKGPDRLGSIFLDFDLVEVWLRVGKNCVIIAAMLATSALVALFAATRLQRFITRPILDLANLANAVSEKHDYSVRAAKHTEDEIGFLIDCFNGMLGQMEKHEKTLREVNQQLARSEQRAQAATEAKSQFLANMSHELRTPLNAIIGYSEMVEEELEEQGHRQLVPDLQKIHAAAKHQLGLINDILDLSKIEAGKMTLFLEVFDLAATVHEVVNTIQPLVSKNGNRLELDCPANLGMIRSDQTKVRQVLFNLLSNAAKFTEKGTIRLHVSRAPRTQDQNLGAGSQNPGAGAAGNGEHQAGLTDDLLRADGQIVFTVTDTGIGMSPDQLGRLFQAFTQAEAATTRKYGGTGLGLVISKKFCQTMGGDLTATSELGKGSVFTVTLPANTTEPFRGARGGMLTVPTALPAETRAAGSAILVIDDEPAARDLVQRALTKQGYQVETAASGPEGLARARQLLPAAITLDVMMAGMDGWAVLSALKADPLTADIPVIMLTVVDDKNLGFALGAADFLIKPIDWDRLTSVLEKLKRKRVSPQVLIIEDEPETRELLRRAVEKQGWQVVEAENGRVGLERVAAQVPGLILLDLLMPEMDGFAFMEELRRRPNGGHVPVIVVTAKDLTDEDRRRLNGHVIQILQKGGHSTQELVDEIYRLLASATDLAKDI